MSNATMAEPVDLTSPLMTADDVAFLLAVRPSTVYELSRRQGDPLPSVRVGRAKRFVRARVEDWLARQAT